MGIYYLVLVVIILLAGVVLVAVALAQPGRTGRAGNRLSGQLKVLMHHLNGEARAPRLLEAMVCRAAQVPERRVGEPSPATATGRQAEQNPDQAAA